MQRLDFLVPVTPPPDIHVFVNKPTASTNVFPGLNTPNIAPILSNMPQVSPTLKRKASTELRGPPDHNPPFPAGISSSTMLENPFAAFAALGMLPNMPSMKNDHSQSSTTASSAQSAAPSFTTTSTSTTTTTTAPDKAKLTAIPTPSTITAKTHKPTFTATTSPLPSPSCIPGPSVSNSAAASGSIPTPLPLPTTPMMGGFPHDVDAAKYATAVSRIATYYQQRCQAIANFQHQKCQAWATVQRQKCQETMQAAMLVVAWYVRDRIRRRRKKQKRRFYNGLKALGARSHKGSPSPATDAEAPRVNKSDAIHRWIHDIPEEMNLPDVKLNQSAADAEDGTSSTDDDIPIDRDGKLLQIADNLIKSQYRKLNVPLLGLLTFDESSGESDDGDDSTSHLGQDEDDDDDDDDDEDEDGELDEDIDIERTSPQYTTAQMLAEHNTT
ncbi:hypothetical protein BROUX41_000076 [Berkeleyomyces rouxiae]|uniref:uncharacterized protein n=1 Tax=Berkeleyomyces rouxiae TaxID=2035830 RepID=UPI003B768709